jgi:hypothetical protein
MYCFSLDEWLAAKLRALQLTRHFSQAHFSTFWPDDDNKQVSRVNDSTNRSFSPRRHWLTSVQDLSCGFTKNLMNAH